MIQSSSSKPIGVFDSGMGGLTVLKAMRAALPGEKFIYLGDTARVPYGNRTPETIRRYALQSATFLVQRGIKALVIACNTATAYAAEQIAQHFDIPVVEVVRPVSQWAVQKTQRKVIGILGTRATISSQIYLKAIHHLDPDIQVVQQACPLFVPLVEEGWTDGEVPEKIAMRYLAPLAAFQLDTLILGCTHYPLLRGTLTKVLDQLFEQRPWILDSATATAQALRHLLQRQVGLRQGPITSPEYWVTDDPDRFKGLGERFMGERIEKVECIKVNDL